MDGTVRTIDGVIYSKLLFNPSGSIVVEQNGEVIGGQTNLFTKYGLESSYKPGKNIIMRNSDGGLFKYFYVGDGTATLTPDSTGLSSHTATATRISSSLTYRTDAITGIRYAIFTTEWLLAAGIEGFVEFCMSDNADPALGMLCGKSLESPLELDPLEATTIRYMVQIPIISSIVTLNSGTVNIAGTNYPYTIEGKFHEEEANQMSTIFPVVSSLVTSGNLSRIYVNSNLWSNNQSKYICDITVDSTSVVYDIQSAIVNYDSTILVSNVSMANSDPGSVNLVGFPIRIVFQTSPTKPINLDMNFFVKLIIEVEN